MSVSTLNEQYVLNASRWRTMRDVRAGEDIIHASGESYLPRLVGQSDEHYAAFVERAEFYNATDRTANGMVGLAMRKDPQVSSDVLDPLVEDISNQGQTIMNYAQHVLDDFMTTGRGGTLVDYPATPVDMTRAQAEEQGIRPRLSYYVTENILNWRYERVGSAYVLVMVVLKEEFVAENTDKFNTEKETRYRVLELIDGVYNQTVYDDSEAIVEGPVTPMMNNKALSYIPFIFHTLNTNGDNISPPPLLDLASLNIKHYQISADYAHGMHYVALPTPWVTGTDEAPGTIGPQEIWSFSDAEVKVGLLEFTGQGLGALSDELTLKEKRMASLGASIISESGGGLNSESATQSSIDYHTETSLLARIVNMLNEQLTRSLRILAEWNATPDPELEFEISTDFIPITMDSQMLTALVESWLKGAISKETLFWNLKQGEVMPGDKTYEDEEESIEQDPPPAPAASLTPTGPTDAE